MNEVRIARICWNTNGWKFPSGENGKSKDPNTYECEYGFGHEEWLFDFSKIINGYHYAFLQEINNALKAYRKKTMDIVLYTKENGKKPVLIGMIKNVYCIEKKESDEIYNKYVRLGWHKTMIDQVKEIKGDERELDPSTFSDAVNGQLFNICFKPEDVFFFKDKKIQDNASTPAWFKTIKCFRYVLLTTKYEKQIRKTF